ncbi:MAG: DUF6569 family protein [Candidatus Thorarchaeota archaeon]
MSTTNKASHVRAFADEILQQSNFSLEGPISHSGLSLIPIVPVEESITSDEFINAAEAFEAEHLVITEAGDAVETIIAKNTGQKSILIEESEVLVAPNSQDRIVVSSVILQPGEEKRIPVKCVHAPHGLNQGAGFQSTGAGSLELKRKVRKMKYRSIMTDVEHYQPETAVDQSEVWSEVERYCKTLGMEDPTKYTDALAKVQEKATEVAREIRSSLPDNTCGVIVIDSKGEAVAFEMYRRPQAFSKRAGYLESLTVELYNVEKKPLEGEAAWSSALQLLLKMKEIDDDKVASRVDSESAMIGLDDLRGEAVLAPGSESILYCSLSL